MPGNLNELIMCFDFANNLPEVNAIQNGLRKKSGGYRHGGREARPFRGRLHLCEVGHRHDGQGQHLAPNGKPFPDPDVLLLSYTGCFTFMKWFELLREQYKCETIMLHTPYEGDGKITDEHARLHGQAAERGGDPEAREGERRQVRHRPVA